MGLFNAILGNATEVDLDKLQKEFDEIICDGEKLEYAFSVIRDKWVFTSKRLIILDIQGVTGKKREYLSIPYCSIIAFSIETTGNFDLDSEMKLWIKGMAEPLKKEFGRNVNIKELQRALAAHVG